MTNLKLININNQIQDDKKLILKGLLNKKQKYLLPKYFYDEKGSKLFNKITNLKEYYPTNKELEILGNLQKEIRKKLPINSTIVEFGSGSNKKINKFIKSLSEPKEYIPIDISKEYLFENASIIAKKSYVRKALKGFQKNFIKKSKLVVVEGRDIGSKIMPNADLKLFFTCSTKEKAKRRLKEFKNLNTEITLKKVEKALIQRDKEDTKRKISPLIMTKNAVLVDTTKLTIKQMEAKLINLVKNSIKKKYGNL